MENQNNILILIYVGVKFQEKDLAKSQGAHWDNERKKWFFSFLLDEFLADEAKHTYQFKPFSINISYLYAKKYGEVERVNEINRCFNIAKNRNLIYLESLEEKFS